MASRRRPSRDRARRTWRRRDRAEACGGSYRLADDGRRAEPPRIPVLQVAVDEFHPLPYGEIANGALSDLGKELRERKFLTEVFLHRCAKHDEVERLEGEVGKQTRVGGELTVELPVAGHSSQQLEHRIENLIVPWFHVATPSRMAAAQAATIHSPSCAVDTVAR